jgi:predicted DsbA family dithiol-disulfide isomerase
LLFLPFAWKKEANKKRIWSILFFISSIFSIYSVILAFISAYYIHSYCIMCILSFGLSFFLLYYTWLIRKRFDKLDIAEGLRLDIDYLWKFRNKTLPVFLPFFSFVLILLIAFPVYWNLAPRLLSKEMLHGITKDGHPWIGARNPELEITEFADFQCFQCKKMHFFLRQLINEYPDKIRLIHRHFPMDHNFNPIVKQPFHKGSGKMALLAIYAASKGKFWQMNDVLYQIDSNAKTINIKELADEVGLNPEEIGHSVNNQLIRKKLQSDILSGLKLRISGTPAYVINKEVYLGQIPPEIIKGALKR